MFVNLLSGLRLKLDLCRLVCIAPLMITMEDLHETTTKHQNLDVSNPSRECDSINQQKPEYCLSRIFKIPCR